MRKLPFALALAAALAALPAAAQDGQAPTASGTTTTTVPGGAISMGQPVAPDGQELGKPYVKAEHGDWDIRCIRTESGNDPCQLYQLLKDSQDNSVAEFTMFPLIPPQGEAIAGGNIISPLETLLTEGVTLVIDGGEARRFPFHYCAQAGCVSRIGFSQADIDRFKRGKEGAVSVVPVVAADKRISLTLSLSGFTAAYDQIVAETQAAVAAAQAASQNGTQNGAQTGGN